MSHANDIMSMSDDELAERYVKAVSNTSWGASSILTEMERRARNHQAKAQARLSYITVGVACLSMLIALGAWVTSLNA